jgi:DNA-binding MarR family transcriptional regulator
MPDAAALVVAEPVQSDQLRHVSPNAGDRALALAFVEDLELGAPDRLVLAALLHRAGSATGIAWPTIGELADATSLRPRSVQRVVRRLVERRLVERELVAPGEKMPHGFVTPTTRALFRLSVPSDVAPFVGRALAPILRADLPTTEKTVLVVVAMHANAKGDSWPSYARIGRMTGLSERAVGGALARLRARGWLVARRVAPGAPLPSGETATAWRVVFALRPRPGCIDPTTDVHRPPDPGAEEGSPRTSSSTEEALPHAGDVGALLRDFGDRLLTDDLGADATKIVLDRLADGFTVVELRTAIAGVASVPWRMELRSRRTVRAVFGTAAKCRSFVERGREDEPEEMLPPPPPLPPRDPGELRARAVTLRATLDAWTARPAFLRADRAT